MDEKILYKSTYHIDRDLHLELKEYCKKNGLKINFFIEQIIKEKLESIKNNEKKC